MEIIVAALLGAGFLHAFYGALKVRWPSAYFGASESFEQAVSATLWRYLAFRAVPVFATAVFVGVSVDRMGSTGWVSIVLLLVIHFGMTSGRAVLGLRRSPRGERKYAALLALQTAAALMLAVVGFGAVLARGRLATLVPGVDEVVAGLWTAVAAGVLGAYLIAIANARQDSSLSQEAASRARIPSELWRVAKEEALRNDGDQYLVQAIMVAENLQRPRWFRKLERAKGLVWKAGTYGIMQVESPRPLSDVESIEAAARGVLAGVVVPTDPEGRWPDIDWLRGFVIERYNADRSLAEQVVNLYIELWMAENSA